MPTEVRHSLEAEFVELLPLIARVARFVARRHHLSQADAEDFESDVRVKLLEDDYAVLRKFRGRSSMRTYLTVVISRLCLDYQIAAWGKWRPSAEAKRAGRVGVVLERLLVRDRHTFEEACEILKTNHGISLARADLERVAARFPVRALRRFEPDSVLADIADPGMAPEAMLTASEREAQSERVLVTLTTVQADLPSQDQLILALRFEDGLPVSEIAQIVGIEQKALYRHLERLYRTLRQALGAEGIDPVGLFDPQEGER